MRVITVVGKRYPLRTKEPLYPQLNTGRRGKPNVRAAVLADLRRAERIKASLRDLTHEAIAKRHGIDKRTVNKISKSATVKAAPHPLSGNGFGAKPAGSQAE